MVSVVAALTTVRASAGYAQTDRARTTVQSTLTEVYQRFLTGIRRRDTSSYRDLLTPDYVYIGGDSSAVVSGRTSRLKMDASSTNRWDVFDAERCDLVVRDATAVGPCWYHAKGVSEGQHGDWHGISLVTFVRSASGQWQIAATRPSVLPDRR